MLNVGTDGAVVKIDSPLINGWEKVSDIETLLAHADGPLPESDRPSLSWVGSKMPAELLKQVLGTIRMFPRLETGYILLYRISDASWRVHCPNQSGSAGSVNFADDREDEARDGYAEIGTIHTHPEMSAFWSGTDMRDQRGKRGLHIVFGLRGGLVSQSLCTIFGQEAHFDVPLWDVCEQVDLAVEYPPVEAWVETIGKQSYVPPKATTFSWSTPAVATGAGSSSVVGAAGWRRYDDMYDDDYFPVYTGGVRRRTGVAASSVPGAMEEAVRTLLAALFAEDPEAAAEVVSEVAEEAGGELSVCRPGMQLTDALDSAEVLLEQLTEQAADDRQAQMELDDLMSNYGFARNVSPAEVCECLGLDPELEKQDGLEELEDA